MRIFIGQEITDPDTFQGKLVIYESGNPTKRLMLELDAQIEPNKYQPIPQDTLDRLIKNEVIREFGDEPFKLTYTRRHEHVIEYS